MNGLLEGAIRSCNMQKYSNFLVIRILEQSPLETGWDIFSLDYHIASSLNEIFSPSLMQKFLTAFNFLWKLRRADSKINRLWIT